MNNRLKVFVFLIMMSGLMFGLIQTTQAAGTFRTTDDVRFRSGPSLDANTIKTINNGTKVEVLEHNPADWSKVKIDNTTGYIRSDFLKFPINNYAHFRTNDGVNLRSSKSTDTKTNILRTIAKGAIVDVLEHDPAGWSKVRIGDTTGFIRSDFLIRAGSSSSSSTQLRTNDSVRFRTGPSTDTGIIQVLHAGTSVEVLEKETNGWSKVKVSDKIGYIRSDLLSISGGKVELLPWSTVKEILKNGMIVRVRDVKTGVSFNLQIRSRGKHADVETPTKADSDTIRNDVYGGSWSWNRRPVVVTIGGRSIAASMNGMPHGRGSVAGNGMNGHICLHFFGSTNHNGSVSSTRMHQANVQEAYKNA